MPQRKPVTKSQEPSSLRRSPRLLQLNNSPKTPEITSSIPKSWEFSARKPQFGSTNPAKSLISVKECGNGFRNYAKLANGSRNFAKECDNGPRNDIKSANGSRDYAKSANGSRRKSNSGSGIRRSPRLCGEVTSLIDVNMSCNSNSNSRSRSRSRSRRKLKQVSLGGIDSLTMNDFVDFPVTQCNNSETMKGFVNSPVTPIGGGEKKCRGFNDSETSGSIVLSLGDSERRVTRSCSRKLGGNVEIGMVENCKLNGSRLFDNRAGGGGLRKCGRLACGVVGNSNGKGDGDVVLRSIVCGLKNLGCDSLSPCATPGVGRGRRNSCKDVDGRITRSASKRILKGSDLCGKERERRTTSTSARGVSMKGLSIIAKKQQESGGTVKFCKTAGSDRVKLASDTSFSVRLEVKEGTVRDVVGKKKESHECGKQDGDILKNGKSDINQGTKLIGVKRKRNQAGLQGKDQGWTNEQEAALQRAYFSAKPSPLFWKKVSKLVPGKSAQECFDKVHSVNLTPLQTRHSSKFKKHNSPSEFLLTSDELLKSIPAKSKKLCKSKPKSHVARRNVRHLLQKYCQDSPADLFSILEPSRSPLAETLKLKAVQLTPTLSSGSHNKRLSRLSGLRGSPLTSPPVLKTVKNMDLHEKYIDKLHVREGKRKSVFSQFSKSVQCQKDGAQNSAQRKNAIKAAKDALVSDARDVIKKFRDSQTNLMEAYSDSEEVLISDNDEDDIDM